MIAYRWWVIFSLLANSIYMYFLSGFWSGIYGNRIQMAQIPLGAMITYAVLSHGLAGTLFNAVDSIINDKVKTGDLALDLLKPCDLMGYIFAQALGRSYGAFFVNTLPTFLVAFPLLRLEHPTSLIHFVSFLLSFLLAQLALLCLNFLVGLLAFWFLDINGFLFAKNVCILLLSGGFIPLWFFPDVLGRVLRALPFAAIYHLPLSIYVGRISTAELVIELSRQLAWVLVLLIASRVAFNLGKRKLIFQGG